MLFKLHIINSYFNIYVRNYIDSWGWLCESASDLYAIFFDCEYLSFHLPRLHILNYLCPYLLYLHRRNFAI
jgi:hypothetical protein